MRILAVLAGIAILLYLVYAGYFYIFQRAILFPRHLLRPPDPAPFVPGLEQMWLETGEGRVEAWYLPPLPAPPAPAPLCIIAHGNGDLIDWWLPSIGGLREMGLGVLLVEYPGYGRSEGLPSQAAIRETFLLAYDTMSRHPQVDPARIVLFGHSVGGGAVTTLAAERPSSALILFSTFTSVRALAAEQWLPGFAALDPFDNLAVVRSYPHPVLIIHGRNDRTIPYRHGVALYQAAPQGELMTLDCDHNGCVDDWPHFWRALRPFFGRAGMLRE
ncbi:MAG TPA: alpha/beta hydrolase [Caldilineaceae bacterium]|nr:alpha/beta hydrolase [Caldilineaceae bacterium]